MSHTGAVGTMPCLSQALDYITVYVLTNEYNEGWKKTLREWGKKMSKATRMPPEEEPDLKVFAPVNPNLEVLGNYEGDLGDNYWGKWEKNPYRRKGLSSSMRKGGEWLRR